jgi:hypothetical protein
MMKRTCCLLLLCSALASGCATSQPNRLAQQFRDAHQGYWKVVADTASDLAPQESGGIRFMHAVVDAMSERESEELRFLLVHAPQRVQTGQEDTPWVMFELNDLEQKQLSSLAAVRRSETLSSEWHDHPKRKDIQRIWRQAAGMPPSKAAWQAKDKRLNAVIEDIERLKSENGQQ